MRFRVAVSDSEACYSAIDQAARQGVFRLGKSAGLRKPVCHGLRPFCRCAFKAGLAPIGTARVRMLDGLVHDQKTEHQDDQ